MDAIDAIFKRRSIRNYTDKPVDRETVITLITAATAAPTAANCQPWEFVVIDAPEKLEELKKGLRFGQYNAPLGIVVCGNMELGLKGPDNEMWVQDCSAAIENMMIAAVSLGLGSVWIGVYPVEGRVSFVRNALNIPKHVIPLSLVYFGYPAEEKEPRSRFNEKRVYWQEYEPKRKHRTKDNPVIGHY